MNGREGKYAVALDSDWKEFDGFERNDRNMFHFTEKSEDESFMKVYLPARTAFVMNKK
jgi:1,4-alpha-glucan branching enzyme